jgi:hypothetical protein
MSLISKSARVLANHRTCQFTPDGSGEAPQGSPVAMDVFRLSIFLSPLSGGQMTNLGATRQQSATEVSVAWLTTY